MIESATALETPAKQMTAEDIVDRVTLFAISGAAIVLLWFGLITSSFWLDETGTWWIVKDGPAQAIHRALQWSGQSPFYYLTAWYRHDCSD